MKTTLFLSACAVVALMSCSSGSCKDSSQSCNCKQSDSTNIVLDLHRHIKPESVAAFKASFAECKKSTVEEPGCIDYGVYQSPEDSTHFFIHEQWANQTELEKHWETPHLKKHVAETADMCVEKNDLHIPLCPCAKQE